MLTKVEVISGQGAVLTLPLYDPSEGLYIKDIEGLDPVKATLVSSSFSTVDGAQYQSSRRETRNIIMKLGMEMGYGLDIRGLRTKLYSFFMPKTSVRLRFYVEGVDPVDIVGYIETMEAALFTQDPEAFISLICFDPDFYEPTPNVINGMTVTNTTEFPVEYDGTVETGIRLSMTLNRAQTSLDIYHRAPDGTLRSLEFEAALLSADKLLISTVTGDKKAIRTRAGADTSILYGISPFSNWINLFPGTNYLRVVSDGAPIAYTIEYTTKHGGL
ncbi:minor tail protein [Arthrobacter phage Sporto]|nr:minor tail protein [Arthrobacter phage Sporto]